MQIDDPNTAFEKQYFEKQENSPLDLAVFVGKLALPKAAFLFEVFQKVYNRFQRATVEERIKALWDRFVQETEYIEKTKINAADLEEAIQLALRRDAEEFNDNKRDRYVKLIGNALRSEAGIEDLSAFVQTVEQLGEADIQVLKAMNLVMNRPADWTDQSGNPRTVLHPNTFIQRRQELAVQIAQALGQRTDLSSQVRALQTFSHEEGYSVCARLQGFGLAHEVHVNDRQVPIGDYCFRPSKRGLMLLRLIGEEVPNWECYFPPA